MKNKWKERLVLVEWEDVTNWATWLYEDEIEEKLQDKSYLCHNIGWVVKETKRYICVSSRRSKVGAWGLTERIPKGMIKRITEINRKLQEK